MIRSINVSVKGIEVLPNGYFYSGGVARSALAAIQDRALGYRDIDVVRINDINPSFELDRELSLKYMEDDYAHGHGVHNEVSIKDYMATRDFTINQVLFDGEVLWYTDRAYTDMYHKEFEIIEFNDKLFCKAVRFECLGFNCTNLIEVKDYLFDFNEEWSNYEPIREFMVWLHGERANEQGVYDLYMDRINWILQEDLDPSYNPLTEVFKSSMRSGHRVRRFKY